MQDSDSVINLRISATLARLSRSYVVARDSNEEEPPDYDTAIKIMKKEDEDLPSYCQAVTSIEDVRWPFISYWDHLKVNQKQTWRKNNGVEKA